MGYLRTGMLLRAKRQVTVLKPIDDLYGDFVEVCLDPGEVLLLSQMSGEQTKYSVLELTLLGDLVYYYQSFDSSPWQTDFEVARQ